MQIKQYQKESVRTMAKLEGRYIDNLHMVLGMITEVGELADVFKKEMAYGKPVDWVNVKEEIGDVMFYIANFCNVNGFDLEEILQTNINKLRARYPEKFTEENAMKRDLNKERKILEG
jgi:NTP pyrophosphatase (non-canonical NTP hydrolase)